MLPQKTTEGKERLVTAWVVCREWHRVFPLQIKEAWIWNLDDL